MMNPKNRDEPPLYVYYDYLSAIYSPAFFFIQKIFFPIFSRIFPVLHLYLTNQLFRLIFRSLTIEEHTPSCIWVLVSGFLPAVWSAARPN